MVSYHDHASAPALLTRDDRMNLMRSLDPWVLLQRCHHLSSTIFRSPGIASGTGAATLQTVVTPDQITWNESGRWLSGPLAGSHFTNATFWRRDPDGGLLLGHLRRGSAHPTSLVTLVEAGSSHWVSRAPHACGEDSYAASLTLSANDLWLTWRVESPTDPYTLLIHGSA